MFNLNKKIFSLKEDHILSKIKHRHYPLPQNSWFLHQNWKNILFAHWSLDPELLQRYLPDQMKLDTFKGKGWISITSLEMEEVRLRNLPPIPTTYNFFEVNVRTYVIYKNIPGVYYFSLDASSWLSVLGARWTTSLPYFNSEIIMQKKDDGEYFRHSKRKGQPPAEIILSFKPLEEDLQTDKLSVDSWLTERYCLFTQVPGNKIHQIPIHHLPWKLKKTEAEIKLNTMTFPLGLMLKNSNVLFHFSEEQEVFIWEDQKI